MKIWYGFLGSISFPRLHTSSRYITGTYTSFPWNVNVFLVQCQALMYSKQESGDLSPKSFQGSKTCLAMVQPPGNQETLTGSTPLIGVQQNSLCRTV